MRASKNTLFSIRLNSGEFLSVSKTDLDKAIKLCLKILDKTNTIKNVGLEKKIDCKFVKYSLYAILYARYGMRVDLARHETKIKAAERKFSAPFADLFGWMLPGTKPDKCFTNNSVYVVFLKSKKSFQTNNFHIFKTSGSTFHIKTITKTKKVIKAA